MQWTTAMLGTYFGFSQINLLDETSLTTEENSNIAVLLSRGWNESRGCRWDNYQQRKRGACPLLLVS